MYKKILLSVVVFTCCAASAQFYPDSSATWCLEVLGPPPPFEGHIIQQMSASPDTSISGQTYKEIIEFNDLFGTWALVARHYVRSAQDGKGYAFLPDSMAEYLTGDTAALPGDTLHNVLAWYDSYVSGGCPSGGLDYGLFDVVVDSVATLTNDGITVHRQFIHLACATIVLYPDAFFWQAGMGTSFGPTLRLGDFSGFVEVIDCMNVAGINQYGSNSLPGGPPCCSPLTTCMEALSPKHGIRVTPNPSPGLFEFNGADRATIQILDAQGRLLLLAEGPVVDLSAYPPGCYHARVPTRIGMRQVCLLLVK